MVEVSYEDVQGYGCVCMYGGYGCVCMVEGMAVCAWGGETRCLGMLDLDDGC